MATFISSRSVGSSLYIGASTTSGYWKCTKWNGTVVLGFGTSGNKVYIGLSPNEPLTIVPCHSDGSIDTTGHITGLDLGYNDLTSINLTGLSYLTNLNIPGNQLTSINLTGLSSLTQLNLSDNQLTSFNGSGLSSLIQLHLSGNQLTSFHGYTFSPTGLASLTFLDLQNNQLTSFNGSGLFGLTQLYLSSNQLTSFVGTDLSSLTLLALHENQLTEFDGTGLSSLTNLNLNNNHLAGFTGTGLSSLTRLGLSNNQLTEFDGTGLSSLTDLSLTNNQLATFDGAGLTSLTNLDLTGNPLVTFIGGDMGLILGLNFSTGSGKRGGWNITTLETFDGTGLSSLTSLNLSGNPLTTFIGGDMGITELDFSSVLGGWNITTLETCDIAGLSGLTNLNLTGNQLTPQNWDSILSDLVDLGNDQGSLIFSTAQRTAISNNDYTELADTLMWTIDGTFEIYTPPTLSTFITSKLTGETIDIYVETTTGYWKYNHNGTDSSVFNQNDGQQSAEVLNENGEFTIISCDPAGSILGEGSANGDITYLELPNNQITTFNGTGLSSLTYLDLGVNQLTEFDGTDLSSLTELYLSDNQLTEFDGTDLTSLTFLDLSGNQLTTIVGFLFPTSLTNLQLGSSKENLNNNLTSVDLSSLVNLTNLGLQDNQLTTLDISNMNYLQYLYVNNNLLTPSVNKSLLAKLAANELSNDWDSGDFYTTGGRTSDGTDDYDYLINEGWNISGADLPPVWYRFKASGTNWTGYSGIDDKQIVREIYQYQSNGFTYYDLLTTESIGDVYFTDGGDQILATQVPVTFNEFSSSGSIISGVGFGGALTGYGNSPLGKWGTLVSGELPAIPARFEGDVPAGSIIFSDADTSLTGSTFTLVTTPILLSLTLNGDVIDLTGMNSGGKNGTVFDEYKNPPRSALGYFVEGETTFSITWGELVEAPVARKLRVKGLTQRS
jgi:Leucine-rich repeat (LRR) protein